MQEAARKGDRARLSALLPQTAGHPLEPWAAYWEMRARLGSASSAEVDAFLTRWRGTYQEDRLRNDWLLVLGERRQWSEFLRILPDFRMQDDREVRCYDLSIQTIQGRQPADAAAEVTRLWLAQRDGDDGCAQAASELYAAGALPAAVAWQRAWLSAEANRLTAAKRAVTMVAPERVQQVAQALKSPEQYLAGSGKGKAKVMPTKEMAMLALVRLASQDPQKAAQQLQKGWQKTLSAAERDWIWGVIGKVSARRLLPETQAHFAQVKQPERMSLESQEWLARSWLRSGQWAKLVQSIEHLPAAMQAEPTWVYWKAQAWLQLRPAQPQLQAKAQELLRSIAGVQGFYEQLAHEELGNAITVPPAPAPLTAEERAAAEKNPGLLRALYAIHIGLRSEGVREWNYTIGLHVPGGLNDREMLAAAALACKHEVWDRCINSSERTRTVMDWSQRFPMPFQSAVVAQARSIGLDPAYVYGLIRQESRFIMDARSHVGASGLMQVMPATAKWTAKKIGMADFQPHMLNDRDVNLTIGTAYLKLALDDFEGSMPLAAAAYNAGPGRSRAWRNGPVLNGAVWAENVPFSETRDYVKKVLSNTTSYAALITGQPQSLKARLGSVGPKVTADPYNADLP